MTATTRSDRLFDLLPVVHRMRDDSAGHPLRDLLRVVAEEVGVVETDIDRLYRNWFIETCDDWVVPYIGDLVGYRPVHEAGEPGDPRDPRQASRNRFLIPRRDVAHTIRDRRRKGTLALLELLARDAAAWPARAVEMYTLLGWTQHLKHVRLDRGCAVDLRGGDALDRIGGPFDELAHTIDVRRPDSRRTPGLHDIPNVVLFAFRLKSYSVTRTPSYCVEEEGPHCYSFSILGNDSPLFVRPEPEESPTSIAGERNLPATIRRRALHDDLDGAREVPPRAAALYGPGKSLVLYKDDPATPLPPDQIIVADLSRWAYSPHEGEVVVDPRLGRISFRPDELPREGVWVSYQYGFSADMGGGEYARVLTEPSGVDEKGTSLAVHRYEVGPHRAYETLGAALAAWQGDTNTLPDRARLAVIEVAESGVYSEPLRIEVPAGSSLQLRTASGARVVLRLLDYRASLQDALNVTLGPGARFTLDGFLVGGRNVCVRSATPADTAANGAASEPAPGCPFGEFTLRHCTLVPGWALACDCTGKRPNEASLELIDFPGRVSVQKSILGAIRVQADEAATDPAVIDVADSIVDATSDELTAVSALAGEIAHAVLTVRRSTVFGAVETHAIDLAEDSIFTGAVRVARRQRGCVRFSSYRKESSRMPRRFECEPDLAEEAAVAELLLASSSASDAERDEARSRARERVTPRFESTRYGTPAYARLLDGGPPEIARGAESESEMGAFHDLYEPQRAANLRARLTEYTPAGSRAGIRFAS